MLFFGANALVAAVCLLLLRPGASDARRAQAAPRESVSLLAFGLSLANAVTTLLARGPSPRCENGLCR